MCSVRSLLDCLFISLCVSGFVRFFCLFVGIFCVCIWHLVLFKYLFLTLIFRGTCCFGFGIKFFVVGYFVVHNRMHKYPIELIVSILLQETDWCYIGRHPRNSSDD